MEQQPATIGRYVIEEKLGRGGWGVVYRAHDPELKRPVAVKRIPLGDDGQRERWQREAWTTANLHHPHIVSVYDASQTEDAAYLVMELLTGGTLRQRMTAPLPWQEGVSLLLPLCPALAYAHQKDVIHRDIKPENILFSGDGTIKLVDFGIAYLIGASRLTASDGLVGTISYAAPEQLQGGAVDCRADIFALATVLYESLVGQTLFKGENLQVIYRQKIAQDEPADLSLLNGVAPFLLRQSLARALAKNPADRYPTMEEFDAALRCCLAPGVTDPDETLPPPHSRPPSTIPIRPPGQPSIHLEWPANLPHQAEEDELLGRLYSDDTLHRSRSGTENRSIARILVTKELSGGFSGARVLVVIPVQKDGLHQSVRVVKLGFRLMLEAERNNYDDFVKEQLPTGVASRTRFAVQGTMAALEYIFVGGGLLEPVSDLATYYQEQSAKDITGTLEALLSDHLYEHWYRQDSLMQTLLAMEYGPHLPAQVALALRPNSGDWLGPAGSEPSGGEDEGLYRRPDLNSLLKTQAPVSPGELVQIDELEVIRIKPWSATLAHRSDGRIRVRVEYGAENGVAERIRIGQQVSARGQALITRHGLLETVVRAAFDENSGLDISPADDRVLAGLGRGAPYPNPLKLYSALLDEMLVGRRSIIHGDLHPRNILVDRDGRPWLIDFGRVRQGHTLFDFIKLETYLRLDVLSKIPGFTLADYARFEEALANATFYGLWSARLPADSLTNELWVWLVTALRLGPVEQPASRELRKAFRVIRRIRRLLNRLYGSEAIKETYARCLLLFNVAVLKYARYAALGDESGAEKDAQLRAAQLNYIVAAVQGRWLEDPPRSRPYLSGILEQLRESSLGKWLARLNKHTIFTLFGALLIITLMGYGIYWYWIATKVVMLNNDGVTLLTNDQIEPAAELFRQAIEIDPQNSTAHHNLGMAYIEQNNLKGALERFQTSIALDPTYASPHYALGQLYDAQGRTEEALAELQHAIDLEPEMSLAYSEIGYILNRQGRYAEAISILQKGLERGQKPDPPALLKNLGRAYRGLGELEQALAYLEAATAQLTPGGPLYIETHRLLAETYEARGDLEKALREWKAPLRTETDATENIQRLEEMIGK